VKLTEGSGQLSPGIDVGALVGRIEHKVREAVEGGRASPQTVEFGRGGKNLCPAPFIALVAGEKRGSGSDSECHAAEQSGGPGTEQQSRVGGAATRYTGDVSV
jgi:hypothetical protein